MRKVVSPLLLILICLLSLSACSSKKTETVSSPASGSIVGSILPVLQPFEGVLTMQTTIPEAGSSETKLFIAKQGVRTESSSHMKNMPSDIQMVTVSPSETPNLIYLINPAHKSYSVIDTNEMRKEMAGVEKSDGYNNAKIENLGKETVNGNNDVLTLFIEESDPNKLGVMIENPEKNVKTTYRLSLLDINVENCPIPPADFKLVINMPSVNFQKIIRDMHNLADFIEIRNVENELCFSCKGDFCTQETKLGTDKGSGLNIQHTPQMPRTNQGAARLYRACSV